MKHILISLLLLFAETAYTQYADTVAFRCTFESCSDTAITDVADLWVDRNGNNINYSAGSVFATEAKLASIRPSADGQFQQWFIGFPNTDVVDVLQVQYDRDGQIIEVAVIIGLSGAAFERTYKFCECEPVE